MDLNALGAEAEAALSRNGIGQGYTDDVGLMIALMHSELSEALDEYRLHGRKFQTRWEIELVDGVTVWPPGSQIIGDSDGVRAYRGKWDHEGVLIEDLKLPKKPVGFPIEMADLVIRAAHFCHTHGIDLEQAISDKVAYNRTRSFKDHASLREPKP